MKYFISMIFFLCSSLVYAKGVSAGTVIENSATLSFSMDEEDFSIESNIVKDVVNQLIDVSVSWMDTRAVLVNRGDKKRVLTFKVVNSGNGADSFSLASEVAGEHSDFETKKRKLYIDSNDNLKFDKNDKKVTAVALKADESALVFVASDISHKRSAIAGSQSFVTLKARSQRGGSGIKGTFHRGAGIGGVDAIDGLGGGVSWESGIYKLLNVKVVIEKNIFLNKRVTNHFYTNSVLTVQLVLAITGEGSVHNLNLTDVIPTEAAYVVHTLQLDGEALSDRLDDDEGRYLASKKQIDLDFDLLKASKKHTITYKVKVRKEQG